MKNKFKRDSNKRNQTIADQIKSLSKKLKKLKINDISSNKNKSTDNISENFDKLCKINEDKVQDNGSPLKYISFSFYTQVSLSEYVEYVMEYNV